MIRNLLRGALAAPAVAVALLMLPPGAFAGPTPGIPLPTSVSSQVSEVVEQLFELDEARLAGMRSGLEEQDVTVCDIDVCIDPGRSWLSGSCRLRFGTARGRVEILLNEALTVLSLTDDSGRAIGFTRSGHTIRVPIGARGANAPLELVVSYEGLVHTVTGDAAAEQGLVILLADDLWYPCPRKGDRSLVRAVIRHPSAYSSVFSGALAGMAMPPESRPGSCAHGDIWQAESVERASVLVGRVESSWSILGELFIGTHRFAGVAGVAGGAPGDSLSDLRPLDLGMKEPLRFLESCFGPYPLAWLHVVTVPYGVLGAPTVSGPGLIVVEADPADAACVRSPDPDRYLLELARTWWQHAFDAGPVLADGLAAHMEVQWLDSVRGEEDAERRRALRREQYLRAVTDSGGSAPLSLCLGPDASHDTRISLGRGGALMGISAALLGHDDFCDLVSGLVPDDETTPPGLRAFAAALSQAAGVNMDWLLYEWIARGDLPVYTLDYEASRIRGGYAVRGTIRQLVEPYHTPLPLTVDLGGWIYDEWIAVDSAQQTFEFKTELEPLGVTIDAAHIILRVESADQARVHSELGRRVAAANVWTEAVDQYGAAVALDPGRAFYHAQYGEALVRVGRPVEGLAALREALRLSPSNPDYLFAAGTLSGRTGDREAAIRYLDRYVKLRPVEPRGHVELAIALVELGRLPEALSHLDRCPALLEEYPDDAWLERYHIAAGRYREARGEPELAISAYEAALEVNPVSDEARRRLGRLR